MNYHSKDNVYDTTIAPSHVESCNSLTATFIHIGESRAWFSDVAEKHIKQNSRNETL